MLNITVLKYIKFNKRNITTHTVFVNKYKPQITISVNMR